MRLYESRYVQNISQTDLERECGLYQPAISKLEKGRIDNITSANKRKIEKYLRMRIDWSVEEESHPLTRQELKELRYFVRRMRENNSIVKVNNWLSSKTARQAHTAGKKIFAPPAPIMRYNNKKKAFEFVTEEFEKD